MRFVSRGLDLLHFGSRIPEDGRWSKAYKRNEAPCRVPAGNPDGGRFASCEGMAPATRGPDGWQMADGSPLPDHAPKNIPPAWREVVIATDPEADLLVKGIDAKGRTQSVYSDNHTMRAAAAKFARVNELRAKQDEIDAEIARDLTSDDKATREAAAALRLIRATGLRPGGEGDTGAEKQAYGATTLEGRHIKTSGGGGVRLQFTGKKGVDLDIPVLDKAVAADLKERKLSAGAKKKVFDTDASALRDYTAGKDGGGFKPKDFRTAKGTSEAIAKIKKTPTPKDEKEYKKAVREVAKHVSEKLGNTPAIALQSYIDPTVFAVWRAKAMKKGSKAVEPCRIPAGNPGGGQFAPCGEGVGHEAYHRGNYDALLAEHEALQPRASYDELKKLQSNPTAYHFADLTSKEIYAKKRFLRDKMRAERFAPEAVNPQKFMEAELKAAELSAAADKLKIDFIREALNSGVTTKEYYHGMELYAFGYNNSTFVNMTPEIMAKAAVIQAEVRRLDAEKETSLKASKSAYYGEPVTLGNYNDPLPKPDDAVLPTGFRVIRGSATEKSDAVTQFVQNAKLATQIDERILSRIATAGKMRNRFEKGAVGGVGKANRDYNSRRKEGEKIRFGIEETDDAQVRPIYGYAEHRDRITAAGAEIGNNYGPIQVVFRDSVKARSTYTIGDSLDSTQHFGSESYVVVDPAKPQQSYHSPGYNVIYRDMKPGPTAREWVGTDINGSTANPDYIEAQVFGGVALQDIEAVKIPRNIEIKPATKKKLEAAGVSIIKIPPPLEGIYITAPWDALVKPKKKGGD